MIRLRYIICINAFLILFIVYAQDEQVGSNIKVVDETPYEPPKRLMNIKSKKRQMKQLVDNAVAHLQKVPLEDACNDFIYNPVWRKGELFLFVYDEKGVCYAHGDDNDLIWKNLSNIKTIGGLSLIEHMFHRAEKGKFLGYMWANAYKSSYVRTINKDGIKYVLGSGFFPEDHENAAKEIVSNAVQHLLDQGAELTFGLITNEDGPFVKGNIYAFAYNYDGICLAHGRNSALVNQNLIDLKDLRGQPLIKNMIKLAKNKGSGWINYYWHNTLKRAYIERIIDPKTKTPYIIGAGYYPHEDLKTAKGLVHKAVSFIKERGAKNAFSEFSTQTGKFIKGGLAIFVLDLNGKSLADGYNPLSVGQNLINRTDQEGKKYIKEIIELAKTRGEGIVNYFVKNANTVAYIKKIDVPDGKFIVGTQYYPDSKPESVETMVNKAIEFFEKNPKTLAFEKFSMGKEGGFYRGDVHIFVYDTKGTRLVNGRSKEQIWRNFIKTTDQEGKAVIEDIITTAINGGGWVEYRTRNAQRRVYVKLVKKEAEGKESESFVIGSGFFI